jgi:hypothetical protein
MRCVPEASIAPRARAGQPARRSAALAATLVLALATALAPTVALAEEPTPEELAAARALFNEGKDDEKRNDWSSALEKFKKVAGVKMTPQVRFHIALSEENLGKLVSAINGFELAAGEAQKAGKSAAEVAQNAPPRAEALRKRVPLLKLHPTGRVARSRILLDGSPVSAALLDTDIPVDPGAHVVEVDSAVKPGFKKELTLAEREAQTVDVEVDDKDEPAAAPPPPPEAPPPPPKRSRLPVYVAGGVGVASLVGSGVLFGMRQSAIATVRSHCKNGDTGCDPNDYATSLNGQTYGTVSGVLFGVGLAGLATAGVLYFVLPTSSPAAPKADPGQPAGDPPKVSLHVAPTLGGAALGGTF